jgi:hypothetical protein
MTRLATFDPLEEDTPRGSRNPSEETSRCHVAAPHRLEQTVQRYLLSHPDLRFSTLVIRRIPNGVCLEGVLESSANLDICGLARSVAGVNEVLNHLVVRQRCGSR